MGYDRKKVIQIAEKEVGYLEKSKAAYLKYGVDILYEKTKGAGYDNYTKYGLEMHKIYPTVMDFPAPYCDTFIDWCFVQAYNISTAKSLLDGNFDDYTVNSAKMYKDHNALDNKPEVGAQIFFTKNGTYTGCYHTGLVVAVSADGKTVTTIEGNTSATGTNVVANGGCVAKKTRSVTKNTLFGHPNYNDGYGKNANTKASVSQNADSNVTDKPFTYAHRKDKSLAGTYVVTAFSLNLRSGSNPNSKTNVLRSIPYGEKVQNYSYYNLYNGVVWLYVMYNGVSGFVSSKWLEKK